MAPLYPERWGVFHSCPLTLPHRFVEAGLLNCRREQKAKQIEAAHPPVKVSLLETGRARCVLVDGSPWIDVLRLFVVCRHN